MKRTKQKDWLKVKSYTHITPKITNRHSNWVREYVMDKKNIESHRFYPMIHYTIKENKFRREIKEGARSLKRTVKSKLRQIYYSNHMDAHVYSYYASILNTLLSKQYELDDSLMNSVIAYRSIPFNRKRNKCNIDFAYEVFSYIKESNKTDLSTICLDVTSYFDTINHKKLKKLWASLLYRTDLPKDHYKVFRSITKFSYIEIGQLFKLTPHYKIHSISNLRNSSLDGFFKNGKEFRKAIEGNNLIRVNRNDIGIPQGSPISAVLSNLYLLEFDVLMVKLAKTYNGLYRRYSDDIIFVCDPKWINKVTSTIKEFLTKNLGLKIQDKKTQRVDFKRMSPNENWCTTLNEGGIKYKGRPLTYLGFDFDGVKVRLKQKSISSYYRKTKRIIRRSAYFAKKNKEAQQKGRLLNKDPWIYRSKIYKLKTHLGSRKKTIDGKVFWGNYLSYVYNAAKIMNEPGIKKQLRNHWKFVEREIDRFNSSYGLSKSTSANQVDGSAPSQD